MIGKVKLLKLENLLFDLIETHDSVDKWVLICQEFIYYQAHAPHICAFTVAIISSDLLGWHKYRRTGIIAFFPAFIIIIYSKSKVYYLNQREIAVHTRDHDVLGLQVSMNDIHIIVKIGKTLEYTSGDGCTFLLN